jgi:LmbE family N-acetylglucosaminyl deacetylase
VLDGGSVLWVGAHPDDETTAAVLLEQWCQPSRARCTFLVLTRGEGGQCGLPGGCVPDLGAVRTLEMQTSARLFGAHLVQETLPNASATVDDARTSWVNAAGSEDALIERVAQVMRANAVDTLVTFDPRHGVTCHGEHRVAGALAIAAAERVGLAADRLLLLGSTLFLREAAPGVRCLLGFAAAAPADPSLKVQAPALSSWNRAVEVMRTHASQFDATTVSAFAAAPATLRSSWYVWVADTVAEDPNYARLCE